MSLRLRPPGDKSLSHRALILATLASGTSRLGGLLPSADVLATAEALRGLGAEIPEVDAGDVLVEGPAAFRDAPRPLDCGNSGTTARLVAGLVAGLGRGALLDGDASLRARPMDRVVYPLQAMGARIEYVDEPDRLPVRLAGRASGSLRSLRYRSPVASAQVKSSLLLAGLASGVRVEVIEPGRSRDHTERLLRAMGAPLEHGPEGEGARVLLDPGGDGPPELRPLSLEIPGDPSSAAFLLVGALLAGRPVEVTGVALNPTRTGFLEALRETGVDLTVREEETRAGEPVGSLGLEPSRPGAFRIGAERIPRLLDEVPVLAVLAARASGTSRVEGAEELRVKESDRLALVAENLTVLGAECREREDGLVIVGSDRPLRGRVRTEGDHRIAMAFALLDLAPGCRVEVDDPDCVAVSYPGFWQDLERLRR